MTESWQIVVIAGAVVALAGFVILAWQLHSLSRALVGKGGSKAQNPATQNGGDITGTALEESSSLFNKEFHEELRNRGRLHFEKIITENAMFLKQDLDMTIAQINEYLKKEIGTKLNQEFGDYEKAMKEAQELALSSLNKSVNAVEEQRTQLLDAMQKDVEIREAALLKTYETNMAQIVEHYILEALGDRFDLKSQLPFIISQMEANKQKIVDDMRL